MRIGCRFKSIRINMNQALDSDTFAHLVRAHQRKRRAARNAFCSQCLCKRLNKRRLPGSKRTSKPYRHPRLQKLANRLGYNLPIFNARYDKFHRFHSGLASSLRQSSFFRLHRFQAPAAAIIAALSVMNFRSDGKKATPGKCSARLLSNDSRSS
jgi:hypothetical protein